MFGYTFFFLFSFITTEHVIKLHEHGILVWHFNMQKMQVSCVIEDSVTHTYRTTTTTVCEVKRNAELYTF